MGVRACVVCVCASARARAKSCRRLLAPPFQILQYLNPREARFGGALTCAVVGFVTENWNAYDTSWLTVPSIPATHVSASELPAGSARTVSRSVEEMSVSEGDAPIVKPSSPDTVSAPACDWMRFIDVTNETVMVLDSLTNGFDCMIEPDTNDGTLVKKGAAPPTTPCRSPAAMVMASDGISDVKSPAAATAPLIESVGADCALAGFVMSKVTTTVVVADTSAASASASVPSACTNVAVVANADASSDTAREEVSPSSRFAMPDMVSVDPDAMSCENCSVRVSVLVASANGEVWPKTAVAIVGTKTLSAAAAPETPRAASVDLSMAALVNGEASTPAEPRIEPDTEMSGESCADEGFRSANEKTSSSDALVASATLNTKLPA